MVKYKPPKEKIYSGSELTAEEIKRLTKKETEKKFAEIWKKADIPEPRRSALFYAFKKTGLIVSKDNVKKLTPQDIIDWDHAFQKGIKLYKSGKSYDQK